jgi:hypothetical protein
LHPDRLIEPRRAQVGLQDHRCGIAGSEHERDAAHPQGIGRRETLLVVQVDVQDGTVEDREGGEQALALDDQDATKRMRFPDT